VSEIAPAVGVEVGEHPFPRLRWLAPLWVAIYLPSYALAYGWANFLFLCNIGILIAALGIWLGHRLLLSASGVASIFIGVVWIIDFSGKLLTGHAPLGVTAYMWDPQYPLFTRMLSLYHAIWPLLMLYLLGRIGYDRRGWRLQGAIALPLIVAGRFAGGPAENINFAWTDPVWGMQLGPTPIHLATIAAATLFVLYGASHRILIRLVGEARSGRRRDP